MLLKEAELRVDDLTTAVVHVSYTTSSEVKVIHIAVIDFLLHTNRKISLEKSPSPPINVIIQVTAHQLLPLPNNSHMRTTGLGVQLFRYWLWLQL